MPRVRREVLDNQIARLSRWTNLPLCIMSYNGKHSVHLGEERKLSPYSNKYETSLWLDGFETAVNLIKSL